ncbi:MAG: FAD-binding oxidoreductase [Candidatus Acidiferrales bacterium]
MSGASQIANILGTNNVKMDMDSLAAYAIAGKTPSEVVSPSNAAEVVEIVRHAASAKRAIVAAGARTKLSMGLSPSRYDVAIDMTRMDRVVAYDPGDLTLSVEPGITLGKLARVLGEHGQMLPLGVPFAARTTIGGTIASGVEAPQRQLYGTARDFLLGAEFVTGDGVLAKSGGRVVKNVTGYDLHKLLIGSHGTLGLITKLNFKTFPLPLNVRGFIARFRSYEAALDMRDRIALSPLLPMTLDIFSPGVARLFASTAGAGAAREPMPEGILSDDEWALTTGYSGNESALARYETELKKMASESGATGITIASDTLPAAWARKREFIPIAIASSPATTVLKIGVVPSKLKLVLKAAGDAGQRKEVLGVAMARGIGVLYIALLPPDAGDDSKRRVANCVGAIQSAATELGGHATVPWCPDAWKNDLNIWGTATPDWTEMRKVKNAFDPGGILSPGRYVGGM